MANESGKPFPWESNPEQERYITVDPLIFEAIRELAWVTDYDRHTLPAIVLMLRIAHVDEVDGRLVLGLRLIRELGGQPPPPPETGEQKYGPA
jgi:hypothetical protein